MKFNTFEFESLLPMMNGSRELVGRYRRQSVQFITFFSVSVED